MQTRSLEDINRLVQEYSSLQELAKQTVRKLQKLDPDVYPTYWESENVEVTFDEFNVILRLEEYRCGEWDINTVTFPIFFMVMMDAALHAAVTTVRLDRERKDREQRIKSKEALVQSTKNAIKDFERMLIQREASLHEELENNTDKKTMIL